MKQKLPAGLSSDDNNIEIFAEGTGLYALYQGEKMLFKNLPDNILDIFREEMLRNKKAFKTLCEKNHNQPENILSQYVWCNYGGFNIQPDLENTILTPEYWDCGKRGKCPYEGKICLCHKEGDAILSKREIEIIKLIASGLADKEIADKLCVSYHTITTHRQNIERKLDARSKVDVAIWAFKNDII